MKQQEPVEDEVVDTIEIKGKKYNVFVGKKGGKYYINDNGKKSYVKESVPKGKVTTQIIDLRKKPEETPTLKRYIGYFTNINSKGLPVDDFKEWCDAYNEAEARNIFEERYSGSIARGTIELSMVWEE